MSETSCKGPRLEGAWLQTPALVKVFDALESDGAEARVVGGAVRNALARRPVTEIDIATTALPPDVIELAKTHGLGAYPTGLDHGTVTVTSDDIPFEVTTLRRDVETDGRHAVVAFTAAWNEDADRRDFTINALYCDRQGTIYDYVGGLDDLRKRRVCFIGDAKTRIREDYLRVLRFFRFSADFGQGHLDPAGLAAATALKTGLSQLAPERIRGELLKLLATTKAAEVIRVMHASGILDLLIAGPTDPDCLARLQAIEATLGQPPITLARLAALAAPDPASAAALALRLRLSNAETTRLELAATTDPGFSPETPESAARAALYRLGPDGYGRAVRVAWARSGAAPTDAAWRARALLPDRWKVPRLPFTGADVIALGVPAGPAIGAALKAFEQWWLSNDFTDNTARQRVKLEELAGRTNV